MSPARAGSAFSRRRSGGRVFARATGHVCVAWTRVFSMWHTVRGLPDHALEQEVGAPPRGIALEQRDQTRAAWNVPPYEMGPVAGSRNRDSATLGARFGRGQ